MTLLELALIVSLCASSVPGGAAGVIQHPQTKLVLLGQSATFICRGEGNPSYIHINGNEPDGNPALIQQLQANNISWVKETNESTSVTTFTVNILATLNNNYTEIWCNFEQYGTKYRSDTAHMIAVTGPPGPPEDFTVQVTNMTALTLTWTAPWPHPISNYIITMLNLSSGQESQWTTFEEQFVLRGGGGGQCDELQFTVKAVTEVGNSTSVPPARKGFPMGMTEVNVSIESLQKTNGSLKIEVRVEVPPKCSYETRYYIFTLRDLSSNTTVHNSCTTTPALDIDSVALPGKDYELKVRVQSEAGMTTSAVKTFNSGFQDTAVTGNTVCTANSSANSSANNTEGSVTTSATPTYNTDSVTTSAIPTYSTGSITTPATSTGPTSAVTNTGIFEGTPSDGTVSTSEAVAANTISLVGVVGGIGGVILLLLVLAVVLLSLLLCRTKKKLRQKVATTEEAEQGTQIKRADQTAAKNSRKLSIPQVMATNPMYEASTPIYDCITEGKALKILGGNSGATSMEASACGTLPLDTPPQLPVRKNTLESPGVKSTAQLVVEKSASDSDEYLSMKPSLESRYAKSPLPKVKVAEESTTSPDNTKE